MNVHICSFLRRGFKGYFAQNMLTRTGIDRDQYGDCMSLNATYMKVFSVFYSNALKNPRFILLYPCTDFKRS